jgi:hypothetical protein
MDVWRRHGYLAPAWVWTLDYSVCDLLTILTTLSCHLTIILWVIVISLIIIRLLKTEFVFCCLNCGLRVCGTVMKTKRLETYNGIIFQDVVHYQKCHCILFSGALTNMHMILTCKMVHITGSLFLLKACCKICHRDKVKLTQFHFVF